MTAPTRPTVAVVGRPNVGKSTLVNRIVGERVAIVEEKPGVTRDRKLVDADWQGVPFTLVDTGGWVPKGSDLDDKVSRQSEQAIRHADAVLVVVDAVTGITEEDSRIASVVRDLAKGDVLLVANKVDDAGKEGLIWEALSLGLGEPVPVSALHGRGAGDLLDRLVRSLPEPDEPLEHSPPASEDDDEERIFSVALVGRPNVGKSTLFNRLIGEDRAVVHDLPGTTRDTIDTVVETEAGPIRFVDTAGMRRKAKIAEGTEYYSLVRALRAIDHADVALLVIDSLVGVTAQDQRLAERIDAAGSPVVVLLNKHELLDAEARADLDHQVRERLRFIGEAPVLKISALTGKGVHKLLPNLARSIEDYHRRVPTGRVNEVLRSAQQAQPGPHGVRVLYGTQAAVDPPTFTLFSNKEIPPPYLRYLERKLRETFDLGSTPIKIRVRRRD
jgi:GTP-binding protein